MFSNRKKKRNRAASIDQSGSVSDSEKPNTNKARKIVSQQKAKVADRDKDNASTGSEKQGLRGYVARFNWKQHYPFSSIEDPALAETPLVPSIPMVFFHILNILQDVEKKQRNKNVLAETDRKIVKPASTEPHSRLVGKLTLNDADGVVYIVNACRKEHVRLIYEEEKGLLSKLGLCPHLIDVLSILPNAKQIVGGHELDTSLICTCHQSAEQLAALHASLPKARNRDLEADDDDENDDEDDAGEDIEDIDVASSAKHAVGEDELDEVIARTSSPRPTQEGDDIDAEDVDNGVDFRTSTSTPALATAAAATTTATVPAAATTTTTVAATSTTNTLAGNASRARSNQRTDKTSTSRNASNNVNSSHNNNNGASHNIGDMEEDDEQGDDDDDDDQADEMPSGKAEANDDIPNQKRKTRSSKHKGVPLESKEDFDYLFEEDEDYWIRLEKYIGVVKKGLDRSWKQRQRENERKIQELSQQLIEAQDKASQWEKRWQEEKSNNTKLWDKVQEMNNILNNLRRPNI